MTKSRIQIFTFSRNLVRWLLQISKIFKKISRHAETEERRRAMAWTQTLTQMMKWELVIKKDQESSERPQLMNSASYSKKSEETRQPQIYSSE